MKAIFSALLLICIVSCSQQFGRKYSAKEAATDALIIADWAQTLEIAEHPERWQENNPLLGKHPSKERVNWSIGAALLTNTVLHRVLPDKYLGKYQIALCVVEGAAVAGNYSIGIRAGF